MRLRILLLCVFTATAASAATRYHYLKNIPIGGEGGWDYLNADSANRRLYVSHGSEVNVVNLDTGSVIAKIPAQGVHGIAIADRLNRGFISNGQSNTVTIFDLKAGKAVGSAATGANPDAIIYDPHTKRVFAFNGRGGSATVIDASDGKVVATLELGGKPEFAAADGKGNVYVNLEDKSELVHIDSKAPAAREHWPLAPCEEPSAMAMDTAHGRLFIGCHNKLMAMVDAANGHVAGTVPIGQGVDAAVFDPGTSLAFASCGDGTLTAVHEDSPDRISVAQTVETRRGARTMALDTKTHDVYLSDAEFEPQASGATNRPKVKPGTFTVLVYGP